MKKHFLCVISALLLASCNHPVSEQKSVVVNNSSQILTGNITSEITHSKSNIVDTLPKFSFENIGDITTTFSEASKVEKSMFEKNGSGTITLLPKVENIDTVYAPFVIRIAGQNEKIKNNLPLSSVNFGAKSVSPISFSLAFSKNSTENSDESYLASAI